MFCCSPRPQLSFCAGDEGAVKQNRINSYECLFAQMINETLNSDITHASLQFHATFPTLHTDLHADIQRIGSEVNSL